MKDGKKHILVVEDSEDLLQVIKETLESKDFVVSVARSFSEAVDALMQMQDIDALWIDHYLVGGVSGLDLVSRVKNEHRLLNLPIFVVSTAGYETLEKYTAQGVTKYYEKSKHSLHDIIADITNFIQNVQH